MVTLAPTAGCKPLPGPQQSYLLIKRSDSSATNVSVLEYACQYESSRSLPMVVGGDHSLAGRANTPLQFLTLTSLTYYSSRTYE
eukprot:814892-Rhodomonas_salina.1